MPLKAIGDPGPPKIVEIQEKYGAVEGECSSNLLFLKSRILNSKLFVDQTACCYMFVEGNPAPTFKFYKVKNYMSFSNIFEHNSI